MKLFKVDYMGDCDCDSYLTVGKSLQEIEEREIKKLIKELSCHMGYWVSEIEEVDGYKIYLDKKKDSNEAN